MKICEYCGSEHSGKFATGRFCDRKCSNGYSTKSKRKDINKKVSVSMLGKKFDRTIQEKSYEVRVCVICGVSFDCYVHKKKQTCGGECARKLQSIRAIEGIKSGKRVNTWGGRCKKILYTTLDGSIIKLDGSYELEFYKWCERNKINCEKNRIGFKYIDTARNRDAIYFPDFYLKEYDMFVECKGYERDLDKMKWQEFPYQLVVLKKQEIKKIKIGLIKDINELVKINARLV